MKETESKRKQFSCGVISRSECTSNNHNGHAGNFDVLCFNFQGLFFHVRMDNEGGEQSGAQLCLMFCYGMRKCGHINCVFT